MAKKEYDNPKAEMTPMIDVVFQLMIFFIVTIKLADGKNGIVLTQEELPPSQLTIDVAQSGRVSMSNITMSDAMIVDAVKKRVNAYGTDFPCMIRADKNTPHKHVAKVMNLCAAAGMWKVSFVAIQEHKANK